ncbi:MAG TPA: hypothetical protein V6C91_03190 [Coleofasciculaceae cyanobacterium]
MIDVPALWTYLVVPALWTYSVSGRCTCFVALNRESAIALSLRDRGRSLLIAKTIKGRSLALCQ